MAGECRMKEEAMDGAVVRKPCVVKRGPEAECKKRQQGCVREW